MAQDEQNSGAVDGPDRQADQPKLPRRKLMPVTRKIILDRTDRLHRLPLGHPTELDRLAVRLRKRGVDIIDLARLDRSGSDTALNDIVPATTAPWRTAGADDLRAITDTVATWYDRRFGVSLDPDREIAAVPSAPIGLFLLALAFVEPGETAYIPDPGAPFHRGAIVLSGGNVVGYSLRERTDYLPNLAGLDSALFARTKLFVASYPHNPTTALADLPTLGDLVKLARRHHMLVCYDAAFSHARRPGDAPETVGFLQSTGARGVGVELVAVGANFGIPEFSLTAVCGNRDAIAAITALMEAAELTPTVGSLAVARAVFDNADDLGGTYLARLEESRRIVTSGLAHLGWSVKCAANAPFVWIATPRRLTAEAFCRRIIRRTGIKMTPGTEFGELGDGYVRAAVPADPNKSKLVVERLTKHAQLFHKRLPRHRPGSKRRQREDTTTDDQPHDPHHESDAA